MCLEQCLSTFCCVSDKWKALLLASMLGTAITMVDIYSDIFVTIDFLYQKKLYWAASLITIIVMSNAFTTREVIVVMKPESFITVFCVAILSMLGFGPVVLLCYLFFDGDDDHKNFFSTKYSENEESMFDPSSDAYNYFHKIISIRTNMAKIRAIESFSEAMLSFSLQLTYLILFDYQRINWMLIISICISIFSFGSGLTKWIRNYARISAFHNKSVLKTKWYYNIVGTIYFCSDLSMRIMPFVLFYRWCIHESILTFYICVLVLIIWEILCSRLVMRVWSFKYEINDSLMDPHSVLGSIFYGITCLFSSYYYMSQLPFNCICGLIMLTRYILNSIAFIIFFMSIKYSFTHSYWTLAYLALYLLNVFTFLIWLFFKYHWLSALAVEKGTKLEINQPLLTHKNENIYIDADKDPQLLHKNANLKPQVNMVNIKHNPHNWNAHTHNYLNPYPVHIQMHNMYRPNSQPLPSQHQAMNMHLNMNMNVHRSLNNVQQMRNMHKMHNLGVMSGYNPPLPNEQSVQEFNDYQFAMQVQQEQLYKAAQGKNVPPNGGNKPPLPPPIDEVQKQHLLAQQQQRLMKQQYQRMKQKNNQLISLKNNEKLSVSNNTFEVQSDASQARAQSQAIKIQQMYKKQQKHAMMNSYSVNKKVVVGNEDVGDENDEMIQKFDTEQLYDLPHQEIINSDGKRGNSLSPQPPYYHHRMNNNSNAKSMSNSLLKEGRGQINYNYESSPESMAASVIDSFDNKHENNGKIIISERNLIIKSTDYNHENWFNIFGKIVTQTNVQYHWRIRVKQFNNDWTILVGILDSRLIEKYTNVNKKENNKEYFAKHPLGYGIDSKGNLKSGAQNAGKYCEAIKVNDVVDVYFDMKQYALWYGLNGKDFGVAYQVDSSGFYKLGISVFGAKHCLELLSCDVVCYDVEQNKKQSDIV